jgi:TRAP transporter T-component
MKLDPEWSQGSLYELMMTLDSLPEAMGGAPQAKRDEVLRGHFDHAVAAQKGLLPGPYVSLASHIDVSAKDPSEYPRLREEYTKLLEQALAIDPNKDKSNRLLTIVTQRRAKAMIDQIDTKIPKGGV